MYLLLYGILGSGGLSEIKITYTVSIILLLSIYKKNLPDIFFLFRFPRMLLFF